MANTLGSRRYYRYVDDTGQEFKYLTDKDLGEAVNAVERDNLPDLPRRFRPRIIYVERVDGDERIRKAVIVPTNDNTAYARNSSGNVIIAGSIFKSSGRRGERVSFGANPGVVTTGG